LKRGNSSEKGIFVVFETGNAIGGEALKSSEGFEFGLKRGNFGVKALVFELVSVDSGFVGGESGARGGRHSNKRLF
jgi:hypothetical protein